MYNRALLKQQAKQSLSGKWGLAIGTSLVASLILSAAGSVVIGSLLLMGPLSVGLSIIFLQIVRNWQCEFEDMFKGFHNFGTNCAAGILVGIFTFLWSLLFIVPGIIKSLSYSMTFFILADHPEMTANQAITESRRMMNGHKGQLFGLYLSFIGWFILSLFTFGLLLIFYVEPYMNAAQAAFYDMLKAEQDGQNAPADGYYDASAPTADTTAEE